MHKTIPLGICKTQIRRRRNLKNAQLGLHRTSNVGMSRLNEMRTEDMQCAMILHWLLSSQLRYRTLIISHTTNGRIYRFHHHCQHILRPLHFWLLSNAHQRIWQTKDIDLITARTLSVHKTAISNSKRNWIVPTRYQHHSFFRSLHVRQGIL